MTGPIGLLLLTKLAKRVKSSTIDASTHFIVSERAQCLNASGWSREHTEDWQTIQQYTIWPEQTAYELLRPIVLFGDPATQRAKETEEAGDPPTPSRLSMGPMLGLSHLRDVRGRALDCTRTSKLLYCGHLLVEVPGRESVSHRQGTPDRRQEAPGLFHP